MEVVPTQYFQKMINTDDLWEIRVKVVGDIFRILCFLDGRKLVVLSHAFQKKTQKTPHAEDCMSEQQPAVAVAGECDGIVTCNKKDFAESFGFASQEQYIALCSTLPSDCNSLTGLEVMA